MLLKLLKFPEVLDETCLVFAPPFPQKVPAFPIRRIGSKFVLLKHREERFSTSLRVVSSASLRLVSEVVDSFEEIAREA